MKRLMRVRAGSRIVGMKRDIGKLADRLVELGREGIAIERKILEWKAAEKKETPVPKTKAS